MGQLRHGLVRRTILLVLVPLLPLLALVLLSGLGDRREAGKDARESALRLAKAVSTNQGQLVEEARRLLATTATDPRLRPGDPTSCNLYLADLRQRWPRYANLGVIAQNGKVRCSALPFPADLDLSDRLYFQQAVTTREFALGEYQIGRITGAATLNFGYPLLDETGRVASVLFAALDLSWLNALARDADLSPGTTILVLDRSGTILARHPDPERWIGRPGRQEPLVRKVLAGEEGTDMAVGLDGVERFYGFTPLPRSTRLAPVYVAAGIPKASALAAAERDLVRDLAGVAILAVLAVGAGWVGGSLLLARPVERRERGLRARVEAVARFGESLSSGGEDGLAATVLTAMADAAGADVGALYLGTGENGALSLAAARGLDGARLADRLAPGEGRAGRALAERRPLAASDASSGQRLVTLGAELPIRHELYVPLLHEGRSLGVVALGRVDRAPFLPDEIDLLALLAVRAGATLLDAR